MNASLPTPRQTGTLVFILLGIAILFNAMLLARLLWGAPAWQTLRDREAELEDRVAVLDSLNAALSQEIRLLQSDSVYVERAIRQRLNFVRDNEILYLFEEQESRGASANDSKN